MKKTTNKKYIVKFNQGLGFEYQHEHETIKKACADALKCDTSKIYKDGVLIS